MDKIAAPIPGTLPDVRQVLGLEIKLELVCGKCQRNGRFDVGKILVRPDKWLDKELESLIGFTALITCRRCNNKKSWLFPPKTRERLLLMLGQNPLPLGVYVSAVVLFDGTIAHSSADAEEYLLGLIEDSPSDYYLWSRLGNVYESGQEPRLASEAFLKAVELNPLDIESHLSLGRYFAERYDTPRAVEHYHAVLRHCRQAPEPTKRNPNVWRGVVSTALEQMIAINQRSRGKVRVFPGDDERFANIDIDHMATPEHWEKLLHDILGTRPSLLERAGANVQSWLSKSEPEPATIYLDPEKPCPCGSGKAGWECCFRE